MHIKDYLIIKDQALGNNTAKNIGQFIKCSQLLWEIFMR